MVGRVEQSIAWEQAPPYNENHHPQMFTIDLFTTVLTVSTWNVSFKPDKFGIPINIGFPSYEWKWIPSVYNVYYQTIYRAIIFLYL